MTPPPLKNPHQRTQCQPGFASTLAVTSVGLGLLIILLSMYDNTVESQNNQKNHMLRSDYQQREEAFLRALTNIIPNKAIICMQDGSANSRASLDWNNIFDTALLLSNSSNQTLDDTRAQNLLGLGADQFRSGNSAESNIQRASVITPSSLYTNNQAIGADQVFSASGSGGSGTNRVASDSYPPPLTLSNNRQDDAIYPLITLNKKYGNSAIGWVGAHEDYDLYNLVDSPSLHFNYKTGDTIIAKHNWWAFGLSMAANDAGVTRLTSRNKDYLVSLYEIPSQLGINGAGFTSLGAHADGTAWGNINVTGSAFAKRVIASDDFSSDAIASREGVQLTGNATINGNVSASSLGDDDPFAGNAREESQSAGATFPITSAANGGRVSFLTINRGLDFYDRFANGDRPIGNPNSLNAVSPTAWDHYSIGANQCNMRLDIIEVDNAADQTPKTIRLTYAINPEGTLFDSMVFTKDGVNPTWPEPGTPDGDDFPFHTEITANNRIGLALYAHRLQPYLASIGAPYPEANNSICINPDYLNNPEIQKPSFPALDTDIRIVLAACRDLTTFTHGFSLVTNLRLIVADDTNVEEAIVPNNNTLGLVDGDDYTIPISMFAPETRYGNSVNSVQIEVGGQFTSLAEGDNGPAHIGDLKSGLLEEVSANSISANLESIQHPGLLAPINTLNWMVVVREIHP